MNRYKQGDNYNKIIGDFGNESSKIWNKFECLLRLSILRLVKMEDKQRWLLVVVAWTSLIVILLQSNNPLLSTSINESSTISSSLSPTNGLSPASNFSPLWAKTLNSTKNNWQLLQQFRISTSLNHIFIKYWNLILGIKSHSCLKQTFQKLILCYNCLMFSWNPTMFHQVPSKCIV